MAGDALGDRMKEQYENRTRYYLPRRTFTIVRLDGRGFHNYTRGLERPYDTVLMDDMDLTAYYLCTNIQGACMAYTQSDEISLLLTDFDTPQTQAFFDGNLQKLVSVTSSMATAHFNEQRLLTFLYNDEGNRGRLPAEEVDWREFKWAQFDSRVFTIPDRTEVINYFIWRQQDATRNSVSSLARCYYSHNEVQGKNSSVLQEMLMKDHDINWSACLPGFLRGRVCINYNDDSSVISEVPPIFTQERSYLEELIPDYR